MEEQKRRTNEAEIKNVNLIIDDVSSEIKKMTEKLMPFEFTIEELNRKKKTSALTEDDLLELDNLQKKCLKLEEQLQNLNQRLNTLKSRLLLLEQRRKRLKQESIRLQIPPVEPVALGKRTKLFWFFPQSRRYVASDWQRY